MRKLKIYYLRLCSALNVTCLSHPMSPRLRKHRRMERFEEPEVRVHCCETLVSRYDRAVALTTVYAWKGPIQDQVNQYSAWTREGHICFQPQPKGNSNWQLLGKGDSFSLCGVYWLTHVPREWPYVHPSIYDMGSTNYTQWIISKNVLKKNWGWEGISEKFDGESYGQDMIKIHCGHVRNSQK